MYTDGDTFYYRSDRPARLRVRPEIYAGATAPSRAPIDYPAAAPRAPEPWAGEPWPAPEPARAASPAAERLSRLEAVVGRLEAAVAHMTELADSLAARPRLAGAGPALAAPVATAAPARTAAPPDETRLEARDGQPAVRIVQMEQVAEQAPAAPPPQVKVSLFAGGGATAILGHVKVTQP